MRPGEKKQKAGAIFIPASAQDDERVGEIVAVGPGRRSPTTGEQIPVDLKVGQMVRWMEGSGQAIAEDSPFLVLGEPEILAVL